MSELLKSKSVDVPAIDLDNIDELLAQLTEEELAELTGDFDPDNSLLPASDRCKEHTSKDPTGPYNKKKLLAFLEKKAKAEKDWELSKEYSKEKLGKAFVAKEAPKPDTGIDDDINTEWDDILKEASEEELVDLAAVLGFHGMLNQTQYYASWEGKKVNEGGFQGVAKSEQLKLFDIEPPNTTDVGESIEQIKSNDSKLTHLNLNNIKNVSIERLVEVCEGLKTNTNLENLEMASTAATDKVAMRLAEALVENKTLKILNIESNFISGEALVEILKAVNKNKILIELRIANQKPVVLGNKVEVQITKLIEANNNILRLGMAFEYPDCRIRTHEKLQENSDRLRKKRVGVEDKDES